VNADLTARSAWLTGVRTRLGAPLFVALAVWRGWCFNFCTRQGVVIIVRFSEVKGCRLWVGDRGDPLPVKRLLWAVEAPPWSGFVTMCGCPLHVEEMAFCLMNLVA